MRRSLPNVLLILCLVAANRGRADASPLRRFARRLRPQIVNGVLTSNFPTTGALLGGASFSTASLECSGTLIGCQTFLTAGHCVEGDLNPAHYSVFFQHAGFFAVQSIALHPSYNFPVGDVAVLKLATAVTGIAPTPINATAAIAPGTAATIAGFGRTGGSGSDYGLKRYGAVTTATCTTGISGATSVCWNFLDPLGPPGTDSSTCNGDSGGPLFVDLGGGSRVGGVTSGGNNANCLPDDVSFDANVFTYASYIQTQGGADLASTTCGTIPQVGNADTQVLALSGQVSASSPEGRHTLVVGAGVSQLRVGMNALDDGAADFDLYVKAGSPPTTTSYDCRQNGANQYAFCEFATPAPATWHLLVLRYAGAGEYQLTATTFGTDCSSPANLGHACDDGNTCTTGDVCQSGGACAGAAVPNGSGCDDGNVCTQADTCQGGSCAGTDLLDGTSCTDSDICTRGDHCQAGACVGGAAPATGCRLPIVSGKGVLQLKDNSLNDNRDDLSWKWAAGAQTDKIEFGNPLTTSSLGLCIYDESGGAPQLILRKTIPPGAGWSDLSTGYKYTDATLGNGGIRSVRLRVGVDGRASISVKAQGPALDVPPLPLQQDPRVLVQLIGDTVCWESRYGTFLLNQSDQFKAHGD
jgi:hypothetical protein